MPKELNKIIVVGGGAAGWLAANHLAKSLNCKDNNEISVRLIESEKVGTIGVGEGTVPAMRETLKYFGISETEFFRECDATFKHAIKFDGWIDEPGKREKDSYYHIFDGALQQPDVASSYWNLGLGGESSYVDVVSIQGALCDDGIAPKNINIPEFEGVTSYGYHLDAHKFSEILKKNATENLGVEYISDHINQINLDDDGYIASVTTEKNGDLAADLFIDCSGFESILLGKALDTPFVDKSDILFVDYALTIQVPFEKPDSPIPPYTIAKAEEAGWIWDIALPHRRGIGYVYSSKYTEHEQAQKILRNYLKETNAPIADSEFTPRLIPMRIGYREKFWNKNCVAIGLSAGFVEPLEATGLLAFNAFSKMLADLFPANTEHMKVVSEKYNTMVKQGWDKVIDFVKLHYYLSDRRDTQFWVDNTNPQSAPQSLLDRLEHWRNVPPKQVDFPSTQEIFNIDNYLYILNGMNFKTSETVLKKRYTNPTPVKQSFDGVKNITEKYRKELPKHRELINQIYENGFHKR